MDDSLEVSGYNNVTRLPDIPSVFMDKTTTIYGPSGSGKTVIIKHIMGLLSSKIDQIIVISPTEPTNKAYKGFVDELFIHYSMKTNANQNSSPNDSVEFLESICKRQSMKGAVYEKSNDPETLGSLFSKIPNNPRRNGEEDLDILSSREREMIKRVSKQLRDDPGKLAEKMMEISEKFKYMKRLVYKKHIHKNYDYLSELELTEGELYTMTYLDFSPRMLLIFDDCAAQLKAISNKDVFRSLFYQGRHMYLTILISCQDDTDLPNNLRKNSYISLFTSNVVFMSNISRGNASKDLKKHAAAIGQSVFSGGGNKKIAYIREDSARKHYYYVEYPYPIPSMFGSPAMQELCNLVRGDGASMDKSNPYWDAFKVQCPSREKSANNQYDDIGKKERRPRGKDSINVRNNRSVLH